jgi:integrase
MKNKTTRRTRGTGAIFKRNGKFLYQWKCITGKIKTKTLRAATLEEAEKEIENILQEEIKLSAIDSKIAYMHQIAEAKALLHVCRVPLTELEDAFFSHPSAPAVSPKHRANYHSVLTSFADFALRMQAIIAADVTEEIAQAYLTYYWNRGVSPKTYNSVLNILQCVFRLLSKDNNPFAEFKKKAGQIEERVPFTVEQLQKIWETLNSPTYHMLHKEEMIVLYKLALYTGARCGDLCLLRWSSVDMQNRVIRFMPHKTAHSSHKIVEIPIGDVLYEALSSLDQSSDYVLPNVAYRYQHNSGGISRDTKKLLVAAGLKPNDSGTTRRVLAVSRMGFHGFRHTAASMMICNGVNPLVVRDLLGHTSVDMTAHYTHVNMETKREALQNLNALPCLPQPKLIGGEKPISEIIRELSTEKLATLGQWLDDNLTINQKERLRELLPFAGNEVTVAS